MRGRGGWGGGESGIGPRTRPGGPGVFEPPRLPAIERQPHRDARAFADAAADRDLAAVQFHQALDDREAEPGAVMAPVIGSARLEEGAADPRQILLADADAVVLDRDRDHGAFGGGPDLDAAAAVGEFDRVRQQVYKDLLESALVGADFGRLGGHADDGVGARLARLQRQQVAAAADHAGE